MNFIKLTDSETQKPIYVNIETICAIYTFDEEEIIIKLKSGESYWVLEQPEEILKMIENTINKNNNKH